MCRRSRPERRYLVCADWLNWRTCVRLSWSIAVNRIRLRFERLQSVTGTLYSGDYSIRGLEDVFAIGRKSVDDLSACCLAGNRERFEHELHRLRGYRFKRLLICGSREDIAAGRYHSRIAPKAVLATLGAFEIRYDLPVVFAATPEAGARQIERWTWWFAREVVENGNDLLRGCKIAEELA